MGMVTLSCGPLVLSGMVCGNNFARQSAGNQESQRVIDSPEGDADIVLFHGIQKFLSSDRLFLPQGFSWMVGEPDSPN